MHRMSILGSAILATALLLSCDEEKDPASSADGNSDSETDDCHEIDLDNVPTGIEGTWTSRAHDTSSGALLCDVSAPFTGSPFTGDCQNCTYAFTTAVGEQTWATGAHPGPGGACVTPYLFTSNDFTIALTSMVALAEEVDTAIPEDAWCTALTGRVVDEYHDYWEPLGVGGSTDHEYGSFIWSGDHVTLDFTDVEPGVDFHMDATLTHD